MYLVPCLLRNALVTRAAGTLIVPQWRSAPFWLLLFPEVGHPAKYVVGIGKLPQVESLFVPGRSGCNLFKGIPHIPVQSKGVVYMLRTVMYDHPLREGSQSGGLVCMIVHFVRVTV